MRTAAGIAAGTLVAISLIALIEWVASRAIPVAADRIGPSGGAEPLFDVPLAAKLVVVFAWFIGTFVGGIAARRFSPSLWSPWIIGAIVAAVGIFSMFLIPHTTWMQFAAIIVPILGALAASHLAARAPGIPGTTNRG